MKKVLSLVLALALVLVAVPLASFSVSAQTVSASLSNAEFSGRWVKGDSVLHLDITNGQWLRTHNTVTGLEAYKYMVVRMKGTNSWGAGLSGEAIDFKFGSAGSQTAVLSAQADQLTEDYSNVFFTIPSGYFSAAADNGYRYSVWIGTHRGAQFSVDISEIFFTNNEPGDAAISKFMYNDFEAGLGISDGTATLVGNGSNKSYVVSAEGGAVWSIDNTVTGNFNAGLEVKFTGTSIGTVLSDASGFVYQIDSGAWQVAENATGTYSLASSLAAGTHTLKMAVSHHSSKVYLDGFTVDEGASLLSPGEKASIEFIGDSITAGWIGESYPQDNIVSNTYSFIAAETLGLYHDSVAVGGTSVTAAGDQSGYGNMQSIYARQSKELDAPAWDTSNYTPDYIVINLGTNDGYGVANATFASEYTTFLTTLRTAYPAAKIVAMVPFNGAYRTTIADVVEDMGDSDIYYLNTLGWTELSETTDGIHLTKAAHIACGGYLAQALSNLINLGQLENSDGSSVGPEFTGNYLYSDFTTLPTTESNTLAYVFHNEGTTYSVTDGALNVTLPSDKYLRLQKKASGLARFKYLVARMKGNAAGLAGDATAFQFWFGSYGSPGARLNVKASQLTDDYSDVVIELPDNYFDAIKDVAYEGGLFIQAVASSSVTLSIDELYLTNTLPGEDSSSEKAYYSDFTNDFTSGAVASGYGENTVSLVNNDGTTYTVSGGALHLVVPQGKYLRLNNTMTDIDQYRYMVLRMRGSHNYGELSGNALKFWFGSYGTPGAGLYMSVDDLTADYSNVVIEIPSGYFDSIANDYKASLFITSERGATFTVDIDEIYFSNTLPGEEPAVDPVVSVRGDVNMDGTVDVLDLVRLKKVVSGTAGVTEFSDVGENGVVNQNDLVILRKYLLSGEFEEDTAEPAAPQINKVYYDDFNTGLSGTATATGNGNNTDYVMESTVSTYSVSDGALHIELTNGNLLRIQNTMTDIDTYKYMVVRMRGSHSWDVLNGNTIAFWFGSWGAPGARLYVPVEQFTSDYTDVVFEIPAGYFSGLQSDYKACLFITTERGATFTVDIDEIYFTNDEPGGSSEPEEPEEPEEPSEPEYNKYMYNDFAAGLGTSYAGATSVGNGNFVSYVVNAEGGAGWSVADGVLHLDITNGQWLRTWNNINGLEAYKYMVVRMKGTNSWGESLTGNSISFKFGSAGSQTTVLFATAEQLTEDYSYVFIEIPNPSTFYSAVTATDYRYSVWIGTQRGAQFSVDIDEIFFTNDEPA